MVGKVLSKQITLCIRFHYYQDLVENLQMIKIVILRVMQAHLFHFKVIYF